MTVEAQKAIKFICEDCGYTQYHDYTLGHIWHDDRYVMSDTVECENCGFANAIIEELQ